MNIYSYALHLLSSSNLEDKLLSPESLSLSARENMIIPALPARQKNMLPNRGKNPFPRLQDIESTQAKAEMFHSFANHELQAIELLAFAILQFDVDDQTKSNWLRTLKDEQKHFMLYQTKLREWGYTFGDFPLNMNFWDQISQMNTASKFMNIFALVFEQANLDFSSMYAEIFKRIGDTESTDIFNTIYLDEINHVKHGVAFLNKWKEDSKSLWVHFLDMMEFPITPRRARGPVFHANARRKAGLDEVFIAHMEKVIHKFDHARIVIPNLDFEDCILNHASHWHIKDSKWNYIFYLLTKHSDTFVSEQSESLVQYDWQKLNIANGSVISPEEVAFKSKFYQILPWGWHSSLKMAFKLSANYPHPDLDSILQWNSKVHHQQFAMKHHFCVPKTHTARSFSEWESAIGDMEHHSEIVIKSNYACSGRQKLKLKICDMTEKHMDWVKRGIENGGIVVQPWIKDCEVVSAQCHLDVKQRFKFYGLTHLTCSASGAVKAIRKITVSQHIEDIFRRCADTLKEELLEARYYGPFSFDGLVLEKDVYPLIDLNVRYTVGRVFLDILKNLPGKYTYPYYSWCFINNIDDSVDSPAMFRRLLDENMFVLSPESYYPRHVSVLIGADKVESLILRENNLHTAIHKTSPIINNSFLDEILNSGVEITV